MRFPDDSSQRSLPRRQRDRRRAYWNPVDPDAASEEADANARAARTKNKIELEAPTCPIDDPNEPEWAKWPRWLAPFHCKCGGHWFVRRHFEGHRCATAGVT